MTARTESATWQQPRSGTEGATLLWLDALAGGICTPEAFLDAMHEETHGDSDERWELLSLLDQYYRRGKIKAEVFHTVKSRLEDSAINGNQEAAGGVQPRARTVVPPTTVPPTTARPTPVRPIAVAPTAALPASIPPIAVAPTAVLPASIPPIAIAPTAALPASIPPIAVAPTAALPASIPPIAVAPTAALPASIPPIAVAPTAALPTTASPTTITPTVGPTIVTPLSVTAPAATPPRKASTDSRPAVREDRREVAVGDVLRGRYRIRAILGHGGMGTVFDAIDEYRLDTPSSGQRIAIKVLHTAITQRDELLAELQREFQHLQLLSHPNIVRVHEFDRDGDNAFLTMEALVGALLSQVIASRNAVVLPRPYALAIMRDVGAALAHAHSRGVVHGDINPQNIFITKDGELRVLDFGASRKLLWDAGLSQRAPVATPGYASCQLLEGLHPDARDDLFAFACVAYLLLSGQHPFPRRTAIEARTQRVRPPRPPGLTGRQWSVLREGLRWERDRRPGDVQKWLDRFGLAAAATRLPVLAELMNVPAPRKNWGALAAAVIAIAALGAVVYWAVTNYDSLARPVMPATAIVTGQDSPAPNSGSAPALGANPAPAPTAIARRDSGAKTVAPTAPAPSAAAPMTTASTTAASAATAQTATAQTEAAPTAAPPTSVAPQTPTSGPGAASARAGNAGPIRVEMVADTVDVEPSDWGAHITVRRRGNLHGDASFTWWTESGTAKPGRDFAPVIPNVTHIPSGGGSVTLNVPVLSTPRGKSKTFYVVIDRTEPGGAALGERNLTMVMIHPP